MWGAVSVGRLTNVDPDLVMVITTGTSPAPASDSGSAKVMMSKPGIAGLDETVNAGVIAVVPIVTVTSEATALRTPVRLSSSTVAT